MNVPARLPKHAPTLSLKRATLRLAPPPPPDFLPIAAPDIDLPTSIDAPARLASRREDAHVTAAGTEAEWFDRVASYVRIAASTHPGVSGAFVSRDGREVTLTGPTWTADLSTVSARLVTALLRELKPDPDHWIHGSFAEQSIPHTDSEWVFRRPA